MGISVRPLVRVDLSEAYRLSSRPARSTFYRWKRRRSGSISKDALERISYVLGIYKALHILFANPAQADGWIKRPNAASLFAGASALDRMMGGQVADLYVVRKYLDAQRGKGLVRPPGPDERIEPFCSSVCGTGSSPHNFGRTCGWPCEVTLGIGAEPHVHGSIPRPEIIKPMS